MSKASHRRQARVRRLGRRAHTVLQSNRPRRQLLGSVSPLKGFAPRIRLFDVDEIVDDCISGRNRDYIAADDADKMLCEGLFICQGETGAFLLEVASKLSDRGWNFVFDDEMVDEAVGQTVVDLKASVFRHTA